MSEYEFDAHMIVEGFKTKRGAADEILEAMVDAGIACSLHEAGTLNGKAKDAEIERLCNIVTTQEDALKEFHAEIEQLRAGCDRLHGYIAEKDAKIERLEAALEEIAERDPLESISASIARAALEGDDE